MDKAIERYLARRGIHVTMLAEDERPFSERAPRFFEWFHQSVLGLDTEEYRRAFWREAYRTGRTVGRVPYTLDDYLRRRGAAYRQDMANLLAYALLMGGSFAAWVIRRQIDKHIRRLKRPGYYEVELARRHELAKARRKVLKRSTLNPCPADGELCEAFARAKNSPADMIRFGSLLEDLECYVDNSIIFDPKGNLVGRRGGIRRYLALNIPELSARYKTVMRYKALAKRFRQALGVKDPIPAAMLLPESETKENPTDSAHRRKREFTSVSNLKLEDDKVEGRNDSGELTPSRSGLGGNAVKTGLGEFASVQNLKEVGEETLVMGCAGGLTGPRDEAFAKGRGEMLKKVRAEAKRLLEGCEGACVSLMAALALRISPDYAPREEGGMRKTADQMANAKFWLAEERRRIARTKRKAREMLGAG